MEAPRCACSAAHAVKVCRVVKTVTLSQGCACSARAATRAALDRMVTPGGSAREVWVSGGSCCSCVNFKLLFIVADVGSSARPCSATGQARCAAGRPGAGITLLQGVTLAIHDDPSRAQACLAGNRQHPVVQLAEAGGAGPGVRPQRACLRACYRSGRPSHPSLSRLVSESAIGTPQQPAPATAGSALVLVTVGQVSAPRAPAAGRPPAA